MRHTKPATGVVVGIGFIGLVLVALDYGFSHGRIQKSYCSWVKDGPWSPVREVCITKACYARGTCGVRSYPAAQCHKLRIGDDIGRVHAWLGDHMSASGARYTWHWDKVSHDTGVIARFEDDRLLTLDCPAASK